jgi:cytidine deaminase
VGYVPRMPSASLEAALVDAARAAREHAYAPYSRFQVGAAVRAASGRIYAGCNVESAAYPLTCCAERVAIYSAVAAGERAITHVAVVTPTRSSPCGGCRQVIFELGPDASVLVAGMEGEWREVSIRALLPEGFDGSELPR